MTLLHVTIRRNSDGLTRVYAHDFKGMMLWHEHSDYMWSEGNYSCDCNRHLFFERAGGGEDGYDEHTDCGQERYTILSITQDNDPTVLYSEDEVSA